MDEEPTVIVVTPCSMKPHIPNPGVSTCSKCLRPVWLAPSSKAHLETHPDMRLVCLYCWPELMKAEAARTGDDQVQIMAVPGAADEFKQAVEGKHDPLAQAIEAFMRRTERP